MRKIPFTLSFTERIIFSTLERYSSGDTCSSGMAGLSNCLQTSLMPMQMDTQSGFKDTTSRSKRCSRSRLVFPTFSNKPSPTGCALSISVTESPANTIRSMCLKIIFLPPINLEKPSEPIIVLQFRPCKANFV